MWAQLMKMTVKPGREQELGDVVDRLHAVEQAESGLLRTVTMQEQSDPRNAYVLVLFESEAKARAREQDPRREEALSELRATLADLLDGPMEFTDLSVLRDV